MRPIKLNAIARSYIMTYSQDELPPLALVDLDPSQLTCELLRAHVPSSEIETTLMVAAARISTQLNETELGANLLATPDIPMIESNFGISTLHSYVVEVKTSKRNKQIKKKKQPTSDKQIITTVDDKRNILTQTVVRGNDIKQYMNACVQYNVLSDSGNLYRVKRYRTGNIQVPNTHEESDASDAKHVIEKIVAYEKQYCNLHAEPHDDPVKGLTLNLLNYKFMLLMGWTIRLEQVVEYFRAFMKSRIAAAGGCIPDNIPYVEDEALTLENLYILDINEQKKNSIIYVSFYIPTKSREKREPVECAVVTEFDEHNPYGRKKKLPKDHRKNITVSISHNGFCNIQGGMKNTAPTMLIYEHILEIFRSHPQFYTRRPLTDKQEELEQARREAREVVSETPSPANCLDVLFGGVTLGNVSDDSICDDDVGSDISEYE